MNPLLNPMLYTQSSPTPRTDFSLVGIRDIFSFFFFMSIQNLIRHIYYAFERFENRSPNIVNPKLIIPISYKTSARRVCRNNNYWSVYV